MAGPLQTPQDVINAAGVTGLADFIRLEPMTDSIGLAVQHRYPAATQLGSVVNEAGEPTVTSLIQFIVEPPSVLNGISRLSIHTMFYDSWQWKRLRRRIRDLYDFTDPDCPTPQSVQLLREFRQAYRHRYLG
jgi:hypothetical protein